VTFTEFCMEGPDYIRRLIDFGSALGILCLLFTCCAYMDGRTVPLGQVIIAGDSIDVMMSSCLISCLCMPFISLPLLSAASARCLGQALYGL
jgi:hypothetical protein